MLAIHLPILNGMDNRGMSKSNVVTFMESLFEGQERDSAIACCGAPPAATVVFPPRQPGERGQFGNSVLSIG